MNELLQALNVMMQYIEVNGANMNQATQQELAVFFQEVTEFILLNQEQSTPPAPVSQPELTPSMPSSNIDAFGYDDKTGRLMVKFLGKHPNRNGPVYSYEGVPKVIFDLFRQGAIPARTTGKNKWGSWWKGKVPSAGASLYTLIKGGGYQYQRLS